MSILSFDLSRTRRRLKPDKITSAPTRRPDASLPMVRDDPAPGRDLLLETTVYVDVLQGRAPEP